MILKTKDGKLIGQSKNATVEFNDGISVNGISIPGPGEYEIGNLLITVPEADVYSIRTESDLHIVYWNARQDKIETKSESLGSIDAMVLSLGVDPKGIAGVVAVLNDLEPAKIVLAGPNLKGEFVKAENIPSETATSWKVTPAVGENDRHIILLPCSGE